MIKRIIFTLAIIFVGQMLFAQKQKFDVQGKAGCRGIMPENTIEGMIRALQIGVNTLQMDVVITKDKSVILSQEPYFNNEISLTPKGKAISFKEQKSFNIYKMNYDEVKQFDVGSKIHPRFSGQMKFKAYKPLLSEVIDEVEVYVKKNKLPKPTYSIKTRTIPKGDGEFHPEPDEFVDLIMDVVNQKKMSKRVVIESFDMRTLQYLHSKYPRSQTSLLIDDKEPMEDYIHKLGFTPTVYGPYSILVGKGLVDRCHEMGMKIIPWTVNTVRDMKYLMSLGVDGVVTDYPNLIDQIVK